MEGGRMYLQQLRALVGTRKLLSPGVYAIIENDVGDVLLQQKTSGKWALPAGAMELDESLHDALVREVREETGVRVLHAIPFGVYSHPRYTTTYANGDQVQYVGVAFHVREWSGELIEQGDETAALVFVAYTDAVAHIAAADERKVVEDFRRYRDALGAFVVD